MPPAAGFAPVDEVVPAEGAPHIPWLAFCFAISAIVTFCDGVLLFELIPPPSRELKASPPVGFLAAPPIVPAVDPLGDNTLGVDPDGVAEPDCPNGTEVK